MGKKSKSVQKGKGEKKELQALSRRIKRIFIILYKIMIFIILILKIITYKAINRILYFLKSE